MGNRTAIKERPAEPEAPEVQTPEVQTPPEPTCRHHWLIESPRGALSSGRCKICGEEREFRNSANDYIWDDDSSSSTDNGIGSLGGVRPAPKLAIDDDEMVASSAAGGKTALTL
jgi:hypothetical protein